MATKSTMGGLRLQPTMATDAQRTARLQAIHVGLLRAAERLVERMEQVGDGVYAADAADVLAVRVQVRESRRLYPKRLEK